MKLENITLTSSGEGNKIIYLYRDWSGRKKQLWFLVNLKKDQINLSANSFILGLLLIAMKRQVDIDCGKFLVTKGLSNNLDSIQDKFIHLFPELKLQKIKIISNVAVKPYLKSEDVAAFFTLGVDSFYTLTNTKDVNYLIYVLGFDVKTNDDSLKSQILPKLVEITSHNNLNLSIVSTNLREITELEFNWGYMFGLALGCISNLFINFKKIYISSSLDAKNQVADGSYLGLDNLYSSEIVKIENFGDDKNRMEKMEFIFSKNKDAKKYLRVCWKNVNNTYNCGICEKCVRTKMELDAVGALDAIESFPNKKILQYLETIKLTTLVLAKYYIEIEKKLSAQKVDYLEELRKKISDFNLIKDSLVQVFPAFEGKKKNILFVDFNGVISYNPFWITIKDSKHKLNKHFAKIEDLIFKKNKDIVLSWMSGKLTTEEVHIMLSRELNIPKAEVDEIYDLFVKECENIDLSKKILNKLMELKKYYKVVLVTDNMDTFHRFTIPNNRVLTDVFDEIYDSYLRGKFKKSNDGELFIEISQKFNVPTEYGTLIDDSKNNCACFERLGGRTYTPKREEGVLAALDEIVNDVRNKWEWQY